MKINYPWKKFLVWRGVNFWKYFCIIQLKKLDNGNKLA